MKKVLITGICGSIGIHLFIHIMKNTDWIVIGLDSFQHKGFKDRMDLVLLENPEWANRIRIIHHNLTCPISPEMKADIGDVSHILHLAAMSDVFFSVENPMWVMKNNIDSTLVMLDYARLTPHESFVYFSTDEVYGPIEKGGRPHQEWDTHYPSNAYSASKSASESLCFPFWRSGQIKLIFTNTMNNFGEMQSSSKFPVMVQKAVDKGDTVTIHGNDKEIGTRFYIHSRNAADALLFILQNLPPHQHDVGKNDKPDRYNIVGDVCLSNLELAQSIADIMGKELKYKLQDFHKDNPAHDIHYGLDGKKLQELGWKQPVAYRESMRRTIAWQGRHKEWLN
jgi:dTDP-D-glucose 4,6-dehydratase